MAQEVAPALVEGRYRLTGLLGQGGMATVYRGEDTLLNLARAVKVLDRDLSARRKTRERFLNEARTMARLKHPNVVSVYDMGVDGGRAFMLMELVEGGTLMDWVERHGPMPPRMAARLMLGVLAALEHSHRHGVVHRDVKPHNVLLTTQGVPKVTDFGIAAVQEGGQHLTRTGAVMGTWAYMAPEQRKNAKAVDSRSDVYAAGGTFYTLLTGQDPLDLYVEDNADANFAALPPGLREIVRQATRYNPEQRFASARAMAEAIHQVFDALPNSALDGSGPLPALPANRSLATGSSRGGGASSPSLDRAPFRPESIPTSEDYTEEEPLPVRASEVPALPSPPVAAPAVVPPLPLEVRGWGWQVVGVPGGVQLQRSLLLRLLGTEPRLTLIQVDWQGEHFHCNVEIPPDRRTSTGPMALRPETAESLVAGLVRRLGTPIQGVVPPLWTSLCLLPMAVLLGWLGLVVPWEWAFGLDLGPGLAQAALALAVSAPVVALLGPWRWARAVLSRQVAVVYHLDPDRRERWQELEAAFQQASGLTFAPSRKSPGKITLARGRGLAGARVNLQPPVLQTEGLKVSFLPDGLWVEPKGSHLRRVGWDRLRVSSQDPVVDPFSGAESAPATLRLAAESGLDWELTHPSAERLEALCRALQQQIPQGGGSAWSLIG